MTTLHAIERWMLTVIADPVGVCAGSATADQPVEPECIVHETPAWRAAERLHVYWNAYLARLQDCLRHEFSTLRAALGDSAFDEFAAGYLQEYPSRSYTLGRLGANLPQYLAATRPDRDGDEPDWADFLIDLAAYEWTLCEVFDGPGIENLPALAVPDLAALSADEVLELTFESATCLKLFTYRFPVQQYHADVRAGLSPEIPTPQSTSLAITRRDFVVQHFALAAPEKRLLDCLTRGLTLGEGLAALDGNDVGEVELATWFQRWIEAGFFTGINLPSGDRHQSAGPASNLQSLRITTPPTTRERNHAPAPDSLVPSAFTES